MARLIVQIKKGADRPSTIAALSQYGEVEQLKRIPRMVFVVGPASAAEPIRAIPTIESVEVETPGDFHLNSVHDFAPMQPENTGQMPLVVHGNKDLSLWNSFYDLIRKGQAARFNYDPTVGEGDGTGVNLYIVDSGVVPHDEFGLRYDSSQRLYDAFSGDPEGFHGTAVASCAAGLNLGVATGATIYDARVFPTSGGVSSSTIINGMDACLDHFELNSQPGVMNGSFGGSTSSNSYSSVIDAMTDAGLIFVAASGNDGRDLDASGGNDNVWPSEDPDAITVGGLDSWLRPHLSANWGSVVDLYAMFQQWTCATVPGPSTYRAAGKIRGTSFSAPVTAGMIARTLTNTLKMTSRSQFNTFRNIFLSNYTLFDVPDGPGNVLPGKRRLYIPGVTFDSWNAYTPPVTGIPENTPMRVDKAGTRAILGGSESAVAMRRAMSRAVLGASPSAMSVRRANVHVIVEE